MIINGDCLEEMGKMDDNCIDFIVTDPPYGLNFMGKDWDSEVPCLEIWKQALRVCKPGAMIAAFGGTRTHHHLMIAIEEAGWEIRDMMMWLYGSGFPKSHNKFGLQGYGTALKPAYEPIILAMKPCDGTFKQNVEKWGLGGINIDVSRIVGRWPANVILDEEAGEILDQQSGIIEGNKGIKGIYKGKRHKGQFAGGGKSEDRVYDFPGYNDSGGASRFFYCAKASSSERNDGLKNNHPTVKPIALMKYLIKMLAPSNDPICLDPFAGSGTTLVACKELGIRCVGIELQKEYCEIAEKRVESKITPQQIERQICQADKESTITNHGWAGKVKTQCSPPAHIRRKMRAQLKERAL